MQYKYIVWLFPSPAFVDRFDPGRFSMSCCGELLFGDSNDDNMKIYKSIIYSWCDAQKNSKIKTL